ncbi:MAG: Sensor histidine kinase RcsC [Verrucomicrobiota bacterium]|jgi:signal transduction histidine kinase
MKISFVAARRLGPTLQLAGLLLLTALVWWQLGRSSDEAKAAAAAARSQVRTAVNMGESTRLMEKAWQRPTRDTEDQSARINELGNRFRDLYQSVESLPDAGELRPLCSRMSLVIAALEQELKENPWSEEAQEADEEGRKIQLLLSREIAALIRNSQDTLLARLDQTCTDLDRVQLLMLISGLLLGGCATWASWQLGQALREPVSELASAARRLREGELDIQVQAGAAEPGELGDMVRGFNLLAGRLRQTALRLESANAAIRKEADFHSELSKRKSVFIRHLGHELRAPLASISSFSELLLEGLHGDLTAKQEDSLERIQRTACHALDLVNALVDQAKLEAGTLELERRDKDLKALVRECALAFVPRARQLGLELLCEPPSPPLIISLDARRLRQVIDNLIGNALKFTPTGGRIEVRARLEPDAALIEVVDSGIGVPDHERDLIFQEFHQGAERRADGAGLGLPLSRQIVILHGGDISVSKAQGGGSIFTVRLPLNLPEKPATVAE